MVTGIDLNSSLLHIAFLLIEIIVYFIPNVNNSNEFRFRIRRVGESAFPMVATRRTSRPHLARTVQLNTLEFQTGKKLARA